MNHTLQRNGCKSCDAATDKASHTDSEWLKELKSRNSAGNEIHSNLWFTGTLCSNRIVTTVVIMVVPGWKDRPPLPPEFLQACWQHVWPYWPQKRRFQNWSWFKSAFLFSMFMYIHILTFHQSHSIGWDSSELVATLKPMLPFFPWQSSLSCIALEKGPATKQA